MRILVVGAYGLIGTYVATRLSADGHDLLGVGRSIATARRRLAALRWATADLGTATVESWTALLAGVDAVVNCAGALQDGPRDDLEAVHVEGVRRLAEACRRSDIRRFVHLSAAGVAPGRATAFSQTKATAETMLRESGLDWVILRPGLVLAPAAYGGTALLRGLAGFPFVVPLVHADSIVQVVSAEDVAAAVAFCLAPDGPRRTSIDLVHPEPLSLAQIVARLRQWLGLPEARIVRLPSGIARGTAWASDALAYLGWRSPMRTAALEQLRLGVRGDGEAAQRVLGLRLRSLEEMLAGWPSGVQERWFAKLYFLKPALLVGLAAYWLSSGLIGLTVGLNEAAAVLTAAGIAAPAAKGAVVLCALVDIVLGLGVGFRRGAAAALKAMLVVSLGYLVGGSLTRPDLWLEPLGPLLKIIPATLPILAALAVLDER